MQIHHSGCWYDQCASELGIARVQLHGGPQGRVDATKDAGPPCQLQRFVRRRLAYAAEGASVHRLADSRRVPDRHLARDNRLAGQLDHERRTGRAAGEQELERPGVIHYHDEPARPRLDTHTLL